MKSGYENTKVIERKIEKRELELKIGDFRFVVEIRNSNITKIKLIQTLRNKTNFIINMETLLNSNTSGDIVDSSIQILGELAEINAILTDILFKESKNDYPMSNL